MLDFITKSLTKVFGSKSDRDVKEMSPIVEQVNAEFETLTNISNDELRNKTLVFKERIAEYLSDIDTDIKKLEDEAATTGDFEEKESLFDELDKLREERDKHLEEVLNEILPSAFAVVKETARRFTENETVSVTATQHDRDIAANTKKSYVTIEGNQAIWSKRWTAAGADIEWNMVHYDVQLIGGAALHQGKIAEMQTGEGKTLVATLPAYLNALPGLGVHVVTVNDYLARRDAEWIGPIMEFLLLTIDCIDNYESRTPGRIAAYNCDITYGTNNEFGFDYLRDNMVREQGDLVQGKHHYAMVDEIDSILIDDARTPLIISGPVPKGDIQEYEGLKPLVERLVATQKKLASKFLTEAKRLIKEGNTGTQEGEGGLALLRSYRAYPKSRPLIKFLSEHGVKAILEKTENTYMQEQSKNMHLVDDALFFTIDEKNRNIDLVDKGAEFLAKGNEDSNFFIMPDIATEMNEIEISDLSDEEKLKNKETLIQDYSLKSKRLHSINQLLKAYALFEKDVEYILEDGKVKIVDEQTGRVMEGRRYSDGLHQAIEAKENVKIEAATQTYATVTLQNYFRMYHKLAGMTGTAETEAGEFWEIYKLDVMVIPTNKPIARDDKEDKVYRTEREKFNGIIEDVVKLTAQNRPVLVGTTSVDISEKLSRLLQRRGIDHNVLNAKQHEREAEIVAQAGRGGQVTIATNMAGRGTDIKLGEGVKKAGGLAIIGTERHDSRRVDRQLRGRAGRQGDPGSSQFYVSLEDPLMRNFHSERITKIMDKMGYAEGEVIQHSMVTKSIERAQKKVEENYFGTRKRLLEYDDVMNIQREAIYKRRSHALSGERLTLDLNNMFLELAETVVYANRESGTYDSLKMNTLLFFGVEPKFSAEEFQDGDIDDMVESLQSQVFEAYNKKTESIRNRVMPFIRDVHENGERRYKDIGIPFTDGQKILNLSASMADAIETDGKSIITDIEKSITLAVIDQAWKEHLRSMDELKDSVQAASFEQKDPLVIYKKEAYGYFENLIHNINQDVVGFLSKGEIPIQDEGDVRESRKPVRSKKDRTTTNKEAEAAQRAAQSAGRPSRPTTVRRTEQKIGRNAPCPCGSGKKYKQCHGKK